MAERLLFTEAEKKAGLGQAALYLSQQFGDGTLKHIQARTLLTDLCNITGMTKGSRNAIIQLFADRRASCGHRDPTAQDFAETIKNVARISGRR